jgi:hypothetical protein
MIPSSHPKIARDMAVRCSDRFGLYHEPTRQQAADSEADPK